MRGIYRVIRACLLLYKESSPSRTNGYLELRLSDE